MEIQEKIYSDIVLHRRCSLGPDYFQSWITIDRVEFRNTIYEAERELAHSLVVWQDCYLQLKFYQIFRKKKMKRLIARRAAVVKEFTRMAMQAGLSMLWSKTCLVHPHVLEATHLWIETFRKAKTIPLDSQGPYR